MRIKNKKSLALWTGTIRRHADTSDRLVEEVVLHLREKSNVDKQISKEEPLLEGKQTSLIEEETFKEGTPQESDVLLVIQTTNKNNFGLDKLGAIEVEVSTDAPSGFNLPGPTPDVADFTSGTNQTVD